MKIKTFDEIEIVISNDDLLSLMCRASRADMLLRQNQQMEKNIFGLRCDVRQKDEALIKRNAELEKVHAEGGVQNADGARRDESIEQSEQSEQSPNAAADLARSIERMLLDLRSIQDMAYNALDAYRAETRTGARYMLLSDAIGQILEFVVFKATGEVVRRTLMLKLQEQSKEANKKGGEA